jgi:hypothetical protein
MDPPPSPALPTFPLPSYTDEGLDEYLNGLYEKLHDDGLDESIDGLYEELRELYSNEREYKLDLCLSLEGLIGSRKMAIWSKSFKDETFKPRKVTIAFDGKQKLFQVVSRDGEPVLKGYPLEEIKRRDCSSHQMATLGPMPW